MVQFPNATGLLLGVATTFVSGTLVYGARQYWERRKLLDALNTEISQMRGIKQCADSMSRLATSPSSRDIQPDEVPPGDSIPTVVYESNASRLGLLREEERGDYVSFYSKVLHYKGIMTAIRSGEDVPEADQQDLYDSIDRVEQTRQELCDGN